MVFRVPPVCWMVIVLSSALDEPVVLEDGRDLVGLATKPDQDAAEWMAGIALDGARQDLIAFRLGVDRTAAAMGQRDHAVDIGETVEPVMPVEMLRHVARDGRRTVHRRDDADIVAGAYAAGAAVEAQKVRRSASGRRTGPGRPPNS